MAYGKENQIKFTELQRNHSTGPLPWPRALNKHLYPFVNVPLYEELSLAAGGDLPRRKECKVFFPTEECYFWPDNFMNWTM